MAKKAAESGVYRVTEIIGTSPTSWEDAARTAVETAAAVTGLPAVAYPNRGGSWDAEAKRWAYGDPLDLDLVAGWLAAGARLLGGCCGNGPADIAALARNVAVTRPG